MAEKINNDDDDDFEGDEFFDDEDFVEPKQIVSLDSFTARRRLEQLREDKELERILNSGSYDDYY